ncbi:MAG: DUF255 domain-containing protein [Planctomycetales bacterium]|nr:DUF255 domain-containing protein [Planctomycetales bacterium]
MSDHRQFRRRVWPDTHRFGPPHFNTMAFRFVSLVFAMVATMTNAGRPCCAQETEHVHTNHLINETSPYLLQHAHNPVDWHPWGDEAFAKAKRENKPIFLSVGYSTCYWCHVMEVESFEDPEVAAVINKYCVAIKVDREERPDIDEQYMLATQLMTQRGGWPNSVWLTPDGKPWYAGTYFPKQRLIAVLTQLNEFWVNRRDDVNRQADMLEDAAKRMSLPAADATVTLSADLVSSAVARLVGQFDTVHGGFGGAPKFPPHGTLALLIKRYRDTKDEKLVEPISKTLDAMWLGGIHDHLGGGFHRYATDSEWLLPHFEKMLYDNAQLMNAYADGYQITGEQRYRDAVADIFRWVEREMTSPEGAFYSALDSGEVGKEGEAYVWGMKKLVDVLGQDDADVYAKVYGFLPDGNFEEESTGKKTGENIPHLKQPVESIAASSPMGSAKFIERIRAIETKLLENRLTWPQPHKDDKVLTSWNGLMIQSLAHAGRVLDEPKYISAATNAADFILKSMVRDGKLLRTYRSGVAKIPGYLDDYAYFSSALVELYLATDDRRWINEAQRLVGIMSSEFGDEEDGGFFFTGNSHESLMVRSKNLGGGGNMPNTNGIAAQVLIQIAALTGRSKYRDVAKETLQSFAAVMAAQPHTTEDLLIAVSMLSTGDQPSVDVAKQGDLERRSDPITIRVRPSQTKLAVGDQLMLSVEIQIDDGWHLYAQNPEAEFLKPTSVSIQSDPSIKVGKMVLPPSQSRVDPVLKTKISTYAGDVTFTIPVAIVQDATPGEIKLNVAVDWQACDDRRCLKPEQASFELSLDIVSDQ